MATTNVPAFSGTKEQEEQLLALIAQYKDVDGALIPVLHGAQEIYGVVTFYTQFSLVPKGEYKIGVCLGTACYVKGSGEILERIKKLLGVEVGVCTADGRYSIDATRCIGACGLAPVLTVNDDVYGKLTVDDVDGILAKYKAM